MGLFNLKNLLDVTPPVFTTTDTNTSAYTPIVIIIIFIGVMLFVPALIILVKNHKKNKSNILQDNEVQPKQNVQNNVADTANNNVKQNIEQQPQQIINDTNQAEIKTKKFGSTILKSIIAILLIVVLIFGIFKIIDCNKSPNNKDGAWSLTSRSARKSDLTLYEQTNYLSAFIEGQVAFIPSSDIKDLELTFTFYNSSNAVLVSKIESIGSVKANNKFYISFIDSFSASEAIKVVQTSNVEWLVTGGTVNTFHKS